MCGIDATASGLQHLAALTLCGDTSEEVNVTPTEKPGDIYRTVAEASKKYMPEKFHPWMDRKKTKRSVMCCPYGVTQSSSRNYIRLALKEAGHEFTSQDLTVITNAIFKKAIPEVLPGPIAVMKWLKQSAIDILDSGKESIQWTTPSGFVVNQDLRISNTIEVQTRLMGGARIKSTIADGFLGPDRSHHRSALAPNAVHSMDSALLHLTFAFWDKPFSVIHDCVMGRSCDMDAMAAEIRLHFAEMYKAPVLQQWADQVGVQLDPDLIKSTLDLEQVNQSTYFFC
jgi:DNA-directed RNA polymerase